MQPKFRKIQPELLVEKISTEILRIIKEKQLKPGDKLPPERELAELMGVSRPSLRQALHILSMLNILNIKQGSGTYVSSESRSYPELLFEHLDQVYLLEDSTFLELLEARIILEGGIAELAASKITDDEIKQLVKTIGLSYSAINQPEEFLRLDNEIHNIIVRAARNNILSRYMEDTAQLGVHSRRRTSMIIEVRNQTLADHTEILKALKARDEKKARNSMIAHLEHVRSGFIFHKDE